MGPVASRQCTDEPRSSGPPDASVTKIKSHLKLTRNLAEELEAKGLTVWWDTDLIAGESFRDRIVQEIKTCKAAIVIWTSDSVHSDYVVSEAERARVKLAVLLHDKHPTLRTH